MSTRGKLIGAFLIFAFITQIIVPVIPVPGYVLLKRAKAAAEINVRIARDGTGFLLSKNSLTLEWDSVTGANQYVISWMDLTGTRTVTVGSEESSTGTYKKQIEGLSSDVVYTFKVEAFDGISALIGTGTKRILTNITFTSRRIHETASDMPPDGKEAGINPQLVLKWKIPQVATGAGTTADYAESSGKSPQFRINIGTDRRAENMAALYVNYDDSMGKYLVTRGTPTGTTVTEDVYYDTEGEFDGYMGFIVSNSNDVDITPGTIFYMTIEPIFDPTEDIQYKISSIEGGYTYTPLHFQVTKDNYNNIIITIFKVNQSSRTSSETASFVYEVQSDTGQNFYNYIIEARESDAYTPEQDTIVIFLGGKNINTTFFYRVAAYSSVSDEGLMSPYIEYVLLEETNRAPMPENVRIVDMQPITGMVSGVTAKSAKLKLRWKKPSNYNVLKNEKKTYYHILISSAQNDMKTDDGSGYKQEIINTSPDPLNPIYESFDIKYRKFLSMNIAHSSIKQTPDGSSLEYEIDGFNLFKIFDVDPFSGADIQPAADLDNADGYPAWLMANKIYYVKMYCSRELETVDTSDSSVPLSFTTPLDVYKNPPAPGSVTITGNDINPLTGKNFAQLEWNKVPINLNDYTSQPGATYRLYYDVYMSDKLDETRFVRVGSSELSGDILFVGHNSPGTNVVTADISKFSEGNEGFDRFGDVLKPNFTYYFKVKCRLSISGEFADRQSDFSNVAIVTTKRSSISEPDDNEKKPLALTDFAVALDSRGNQIVDSNSVMLTWKRLEKDVTYKLIRTIKKIEADTAIDDIELDPSYECFEYGMPASPDGASFKFDSATSKYTYFVDDIFPNKLYYFSIRAERAINVGTADEAALLSSWTSITVTTSIIEPPISLDAIKDGQIGINWQADSCFEPDKFKVWISTQRTSGFTELGINDFSIAEQPSDTEDVSTFYLRVTGLQTNETYYLKVEGAAVDNVGNVIRYPETIFGPKYTRDAFYEIELKWEGKVSNSFKIAVRKENDVDYVELSDSDFDISTEKDSRIGDTSSARYYARIKSIRTQKLSSDTKYYIKVRAFSTDAGTGLVYFSKYTQPISTRTDFRQKDYDDIQDDIKEEEAYNSRIDDLKFRHEWKIVDTGSSYEIMLRGIIVNPFIQDNNISEYTVELWRPEYKATKHRGVYIPLETIKILNNSNKNLIIRIEEAQFVLRPGVVDPQNIQEIRDYEKASGADRVYVLIEIDKTTAGEKYIPTGMSLASDIYSVEINAVKMRETEQQIESKIGSELDYIASSYMSIIRDADDDEKDTAKELNQLIEYAVQRVEASITEYCRHLMGSGAGSSVQSTETVKKLRKPIQYKLRYGAENGYNAAYSYNSSQKQWDKLNSQQLRAYKEVVFECDSPIEGAVLTRSLPVNSTINNHWAKNDILSLIKKIDLSNIYTNIATIQLDTDISVKEIVLIVEKTVNRKPVEYITLDINEIAKSIGINDIVNTSTPEAYITRQQAATVLVRVYSMKSGISEKNVLSASRIIIEDEKDIDDKYFKSVLIAIDIGLMNKDAQGRFMPRNKLSRAEMFVMINRLIGMFE